jgi:hypothetical protein
VLFKVHLRGRVHKTIQVYASPDARVGEVLWKAGVQLRPPACATACLPTCDPIAAHVPIRDIPGHAVCVAHARQCVRRAGWAQPKIQDITERFKEAALWRNGGHIPPVYKCTAADLSIASRKQDCGALHCLLALLAANPSIF